MTNRFVADAEIVAIHDTVEDKYLPFLFVESAEEGAEYFNNGTLDPFPQDVPLEWKTREDVANTPRPEDQKIQFIETVQIMDALGMPIPEYSKRILARWEAEHPTTDAFSGPAS